MRDAPVSVRAVMMTGRGRRGRLARRKVSEILGRSQSLRLVVDPCVHAEELDAVRIQRRTRAGSGRLRDMGVGDRRGTDTGAFGCAAAAAGSWCEPTAMRWRRRLDGKAVGTVGAGAAWLQQRGVRAGEPGGRERTAACDAGNAAREHVDDGTGRPRRRPGGCPPRRQRREGAASARGSAARGGPQRLGRRRRSRPHYWDRTIRLCGEAAWRAVAGPRACGGA